MELKFTIDGLDRRYDGEYILPSGGLTSREWHTVKRISGVRRGEIDDALAAYDQEVIVALVVIVLERAAVQVDEDVLWDAPANAISLRVVRKGSEDDPPAVAPTGDPDDEPSGASKSSGSGLKDGSADPSESDPSPTGSPPSDTSAT